MPITDFTVFTARLRLVFCRNTGIAGRLCGYFDGSAVDQVELNSKRDGIIGILKRRIVDDAQRLERAITAGTDGFYFLSGTVVGEQNADGSDVEFYVAGKARTHTPTKGIGVVCSGVCAVVTIG